MLISSVLIAAACTPQSHADTPPSSSAAFNPTSTTSAVTASPSSTAPAQLTDEVLPNTVSGTLYFDANADGVKDVGEVGVPGVIVSMGSRSITSDIHGSFLFDAVSGVKSLRVNTAWLRTQCDSLNCPVGPGPDNDVAVENQLLYARDMATDAGVRINVGLLPDSATEEGYPLLAGGDYNPIDVAVRLSRIDVPTSAEDCERGAKAEHLCAIGDHPTASLAIHNQGTEPISDIVVAVESAPGLRSDSLILSQSLPSPLNSQPYEVSPYDPNTGTVVVAVHGPLPAGSIAYAEMRQVVEPNAIASPLPLPLVNPYDRQVYARIVSIGVPGEADSSLCAGWGSCLSASGPHNKLQDFDEMDESGWNVQGAPGALTQDFSLQARWVESLPSGEKVAEVSFTNSGTESLRNVQLVAAAPAGTVDDAHNSMWAASVPEGSLATIWPGQVNPGGTVKVQLVIPAGSAGAPLRFSVGSVASSRHAEGPTPFPPSSVDIAAFNLAHVVELRLSDA